MRENDDLTWKRMVVGGYATTLASMAPILVGGELLSSDPRHAVVLLAVGTATAVTGYWVLRGARFVPVGRDLP